MNDKVMEALMSGFATLLNSLFNTAAKKGFGISLLLVACGFLVWFVFEIEGRRREDRKELEAKIDKVQSDLDTCNAARMEQAIKIARLETRIEVAGKIGKIKTR